jgi:hypothetical protein
MHFLIYPFSCTGWPDEKCERRYRTGLLSDTWVFQEHDACFQLEIKHGLPKNLVMDYSKEEVERASRSSPTKSDDLPGLRVDDLG